MKTNKENSWVNDFDYKFVSVGETTKGQLGHYATPARLKDFIRSLLATHASEERKALAEKVNQELLKYGEGGKLMLIWKNIRDSLLK